MNTPFQIASNLPLQERLSHYLRGGRIHPAVILSGPDREERWQLVKGVAKFFLCQKRPPNKNFCGVCSACVRVDKEVHPDLICYRDLEEDTIKIDTVRELCHQMELTPVESNFKLCLIDDCQRMNAASANAFLKTLEEPGPNRFFWLLTPHGGGLIPTLLSRCLKFSMRPVPEGQTPKVIDRSHETRFEEFLTKKDISAFLEHYTSKELVAELIHYWEEKYRKEAVATQAPDALALFDEILLFEGRLRSNASYALMLEAFMTKNFLSV